MSKIADKLIEIEELLTQGYTVDEVSRIAGVPVSWVIDTELEMMGMHQYGYEDDQCQS